MSLVVYTRGPFQVQKIKCKYKLNNENFMHVIDNLSGTMYMATGQNA